VPTRVSSRVRGVRAAGGLDFRKNAPLEGKKLPRPLARQRCGRGSFSPTRRGSPSSEGEVGGRALSGLSLGPDATAMTVDDAADHGEPCPGAVELVVAVKPLEHQEQLLGVRHVEAHAVVADEVGGRPVFELLATHLDPRERLRSRELERVVEQVDESLAQQRWIGVRIGQVWCHDQLDVAAFSRRRDVLERRVDQRTECHALLLQRLASQPRQHQ
jgi:hypothetical protein